MEENKIQDPAQEENQDKQSTEHTQPESGQKEETTTKQEQAEDTDPRKEAEAQINALNDKYLRLVAEFDNYKKRVAREKIDIIKTANEDLILEMLEVLDDTDRASDQIEKTDDPTLIKEGVQLVFQKFRRKLEASGLAEIPAIGEPFDTDLHEAITEIPASSEEQIGKVMDQVSKGYKLNDKVIRHAKVVVGK